MIDVKYDREENKITVELNRFSIFKPYELPLVVEFRKTIDRSLSWMTPLSSGSWVSWKGGEILNDVVVNTADGKRVMNWQFNVKDHGDLLEKMFYYFIKGLPYRSKGLILGSHDGTFGHWVLPVFNDEADVVIVDGSKPQFEAVKKNYAHLSHATFINEIVTVDGSDVDWMEGGEGFTDTVRKDVISNFIPDDQIKHSARSSIAINDLIEQNGGDFDWIHFDVEGLDGDLILALKLRPALMIFETMHINSIQYSELLDWMQENDYRLYNDGFNAIAIKNDNARAIAG